MDKTCSVLIGVRLDDAMRYFFSVVLIVLQLLFMASATANEPAQVPHRYSTFGLERLSGIYDFEYKNFSDGDRQSIIIRSKD